ncbi:MAG: hydantoinase/oxoprolinase family protein [Actinobacteria bacterium]|nr:hydantoinase/oxoprolinase family protein [Actinomycetota bacterium]
MADATTGAGSTPTLRVAVDVGGTFTDLCVIDERSGDMRIAKVPSTPNPLEGVLAAVAKADIDLSEVALFSHGTTVATNALITRDYPPAAMITTKGFRDVIEIRKGTKEDLWDAYTDVAPPPIQRRHRMEVTERVDYAGEVVEALDEAEAREAVRILRRRGIETVAICFINAHAQPSNEVRMREIVEAEMPEARVTTSSEVLPEIFEHERFSTTVANAVLGPKVSGYVNGLEQDLKEGGYRGDLLILHSGGGVMTPKSVDKLAVRLAASGIAAGAISLQHLATRSGYPNAIGLDMGGTSTDISLVVDGETRMTEQWFVEYGYPICFPSIEVLTIGAGGGSLAWIDEAGSLRNGPMSAGSVPGPVAYGRGGEVPTNTDANLVLGRLGGELIDGGMQLDRDAAAAAIDESVAQPLGLDLNEAAQAILTVANANMADALRLISVRRGYDPRDFALMAFGGAGPLHGVALARELSIPTVLVPPNPGITSAFGCLLVDIQHDLSTMFLSNVDEVEVGDVEAGFAELEEEARERLAAERVPEADVSLQRYIDMRYSGQWRSMSIPVGRPVKAIDAAIESFHAEHEREHNYRRDGAKVEIYRLRVRAVGLVPRPQLPHLDLDPDAPAVPRGTRPVRFDGAPDFVETPIYSREDLAGGVVIEGPAVIEQLDSTTPLPPGVEARVNESQMLEITLDN